MGGDGVVVGVGEDFEAAVDELFCGVDEFDGVGEEGLVVGDDFEFDPVGFECFAGEFCGQECFECGAASGGVGQDADVEGA